MSGIPNLGHWEVCDEDHGTTFITYQGLKWCIDALYYALKAVEDIYNYIEMFFGWVVIELPSGVCLQLLEEDGTIPDFRLKNKKWWAIRIYWCGVFEQTIPLPKFRVSSEFTSWWTKLTNVTGSEYWLYKDPTDGVVKQGVDITPVRYYNVFSDGIQDVLPLAVVLFLLYIIIKLGLPKAAFKFIGFLTHLSINASIQTAEEQIADLQPKIDDLVNDVHAINSNVGVMLNSKTVFEEMELHHEKLKAIQDIIGVKLTL